MGAADAEACFEVGLIENAVEQLGEILDLQALEPLQLLRIAQERRRVRVGQQVAIEALGELAGMGRKRRPQRLDIGAVFRADFQKCLALAALRLVQTVMFEQRHVAFRKEQFRDHVGGSSALSTPAVKWQLSRLRADHGLKPRSCHRATTDRDNDASRRAAFAHGPCRFRTGRAARRRKPTESAASAGALNLLHRLRRSTWPIPENIMPHSLPAASPQPTLSVPQPALSVPQPEDAFAAPTLDRSTRAMLVFGAVVSFLLLAIIGADFVVGMISR